MARRGGRRGPGGSASVKGALGPRPSTGGHPPQRQTWIRRGIPCGQQVGATGDEVNLQVRPAGEGGADRSGKALPAAGTVGDSSEQSAPDVGINLDQLPGDRSGLTPDDNVARHRRAAPPARRSPPSPAGMMAKRSARSFGLRASCAGVARADCGRVGIGRGLRSARPSPVSAFLPRA